MTYVKTTAKERREQVKVRYLHISPKGGPPAKGVLSKVVAWFTPQRIESSPLGKEPNDPDPLFKSVPGAFGGPKPSGSKLEKRFNKHWQKPRGY
jgi:hypothetical protein